MRRLTTNLTLTIQISQHNSNIKGGRNAANVGIWCNGSTCAFGAYSLGSSPSVPANKYRGCDDMQQCICCGAEIFDGGELWQNICDDCVVAIEDEIQQNI